MDFDDYLADGGPKPQVYVSRTDSLGATQTAQISVNDLRALIRCADAGIDFYAGQSPKIVGGNPAKQAAEIADLLARLID